MSTELILIVDDNPANLKVARFALEAEGYQVRTAADGEEALELLRTLRPRLILMDIQLPGMDGLELTRRLKADPATREIVIVAATAYAMKGDREKALQSGCDGYLTKPIDPILLPRQVAGYISRASEAADAGNGASSTRHSASDGTTAKTDSDLTDGPDEVRQAILVVEDNPATRRMYRLALEIAGYKVIEAPDGEAALDAIRQKRPALIIQDLVLPDMDGLELARRIREQLGTEQIPILCVSGFLARLDQERTLKAGFAEVLVKPIDPFQLLDAVRVHLSAPSALPTPVGEGRLLLVADDDPLERKLAQVWFTSTGFNVITATDGEEALALARRERPVAIVSDVLMPKADGFMLCLAVRRSADLAGIPVILLSSAYTEKDDYELARRVGANALLPKAGGLEDVTKTLTAALAGSAPQMPTESQETLEREHYHRASAQLDRQVLANASLVRRSILQQAQLAVLAGIADALSKNVLVEGVLGDVLASCLDMAGMSRGALYLKNGEGVLELKHHIGFSSSEQRRMRTRFGPDDDFTSTADGGSVVSVSSSAMSSEPLADEPVKPNESGLLLVPVAIGETKYGALLLGARNANDADEDALVFARVLGHQMGQAVALADAFARLGGGASERRYRTITENANDAICLLTPDGVIQEVNRRFIEILGYPAERFVGKPLSDFVAGVGTERTGAPNGTTIFRAANVPVLCEVQKRHGGTAILEFSTAAVDIEGQPLLCAIGRDVTEREQQSHLLSLSAAVSLALSASESLRDALQRCAEALVVNLEAASARIWTLNERDQMLELQASAGIHAHLVGPHAKVPVGQLKIGCIARDRRPYLTNAVIGDPEVSDQEWAKREGMVAFAGHPLIVEGRVVGVMALYSRNPLSDAVLPSLASVADHIALGIERHRSADANRVAEERMRFALNGANVGIWDLDYVTGVLRWSETLERQYGIAPGAFGGTFENFVERIHPDDRTQALETVQKAITTGEDFTILSRAIWPDASVRWLSGAGRFHLGPDGAPVRGVGISMDVTERHNLEEQFRQAQKMEAVGQLAGGVAHDFNNLLTVILGFSELMMPTLSVVDKRRQDLQQIIDAGRRAATLTNQLLTFSRKQVVQAVALDLNSVVSGVHPMLARLIGENVELVAVLAPKLRIVRVDVGQIEQIVTNLVVNARDAMPSGGRISIETANVELDATYSGIHQPVRPGSYVMLAVSDTGVGMTEAVKRHIFEPFFTTKEAGKGTGLGLATVYGIVKQGDGHIWVYSEPGAGTTFKIYLPVFESLATQEPPVRDAYETEAGTETILVVEDEAAVRFLTRTVLERAGYRVFEAPNPTEAEVIFAGNPGGFDLLVTDVIMPGFSGPQLFARLSALRSDLRVLYVSGYTNDTIANQGHLDPGIAFLQKPFTASELGRRVREVIDRQSSAATR